MISPSRSCEGVREVYAQEDTAHIVQRASSMPGRSILLALSDSRQGARGVCVGNILGLPAHGMLSQPEVIG
jgi:hypothetical protein